MEVGFEVHYDFPLNVFTLLMEKYQVRAVFTNHDYEPYAIDRDHSIEALLRNYDVTFHTYKDQVIFEKDEIIKDNGRPFTDAKSRSGNSPKC